MSNELFNVLQNAKSTVKGWDPQTKEQFQQYDRMLRESWSNAETKPAVRDSQERTDSNPRPERISA